MHTNHIVATKCFDNVIFPTDPCIFKKHIFRSNQILLHLSTNNDNDINYLTEDVKISHYFQFTLFDNKFNTLDLLA